MTSICMCGAEAGYPHKPECPYGLYGGATKESERWAEKRDERMLAIAQYNHLHSNIGHRTIVGANFVECWTCGRHAHVDKGRFILHGRDNVQQIIPCTEF